MFIMNKSQKRYKTMCMLLVCFIKFQKQQLRSIFMELLFVSLFRWNFIILAAVFVQPCTRCCFYINCIFGSMCRFFFFYFYFEDMSQVRKELLEVALFHSATWIYFLTENIVYTTWLEKKKKKNYLLIHW